MCVSSLHDDVRTLEHKEGWCTVGTLGETLFYFTHKNHSLHAMKTTCVNFSKQIKKDFIFTYTNYFLKTINILYIIYLLFSHVSLEVYILLMKRVYTFFFIFICFE
jgi:hypothetical protein